MEMEGYDWAELIEKWGMGKRFEKLRKNIERLEDLSVIDNAQDMIDKTGYNMIVDYITDHLTHELDGTVTIDADVLDDMVDFLEALQQHAVVSEGDSMMYRAIAKLADKRATIFEFHRWFVQCLPLMWN